MRVVAALAHASGFHFSNVFAQRQDSVAISAESVMLENLPFQSWNGIACLSRRDHGK